jgi:hypothetical protein
MRKASVVARTVAVAAAGSALFGGVAFAWGGWHHHHHYFDEGGNGTGGTATNNCINVGAPILSGIGIAGWGGARGATCSASANGYGGDAD